MESNELLCDFDLRPFNLLTILLISLYSTLDLIHRLILILRNCSMFDTVVLIGSVEILFGDGFNRLRFVVCFEF